MEISKKITCNKRSLFLLTLLITVVYFHKDIAGQDRIMSIENELKILVSEVKGLDDDVELTASKLPVQELLRDLANLNELNLYIAPDIQGTITNNFTGVSALDVLVFLCEEYDLDIKVSGTIISILNYKPPEVPLEIKKLNILYDTIAGLITVDLKNDTLQKVSKELTKITGTNIIVSQEVKDKLMSGYIQNASLNDLLTGLAFTNKLTIIDKGEYFYIEDEKIQSTADNNQKMNQTNKKKQGTGSGSFYYKAENFNTISVDAIGTSIMDIINEVSRTLNINFFILDDISETITVNLNKVSYDELLDKILNGTNFTYTKDQNIYLIGERQTENLRLTKIIQLQNRSASKIIESIPQGIKKDVELFEFLDLNSIILSGSRLRIDEIEKYLKEIDRVVPVILIEVIIVNYKKGFSVETGISAGLTKEPVETEGSIIPVDITLSSSTINSILSSFNGGGMVNLGRISPNFYISLKALETEGVVKVRSTPKLSTLNGHEASMVIGKTEYYLEETSQIFANQTTTQEKIRQFKPVNADFKLTILPIVSGDDQITLDISVEQSSFTGTKLAPDAPPDQVNRNFKSLIRIRNEEMILLGGLDDKTYESSGSGVPFLSRIPIIRWFFSSRKKSKSEDKLNIFIKPTVIF
jgi:type IV pilus assembly protein PilQ